MNKSIGWVNRLKAFGIIAVILGHIDNPFNDFIYSWHMPLFFIISGLFIKNNLDLKDLIIKDWKRLMIPYFIFSVLAIVIESLKRWGLQRDPLSYLDELTAIIFWMDMEHLLNSYAFVLWFLPTLFFGKIFYYFIKKNVYNLFNQSCIFIFLFFGSFYIQLPFALSNAMNAVLWIFIGSVLFKAFNEGYKVKLGNICFEATLVFPIVVLIIIYSYFGILSLNMSLLSYDNKIFNVLWAVSLVFLLVCCFKIPINNGLACWFIGLWGGGTMVLFILHPYTNNISHIIVEKLQFGGWSLKLLISLILLQLVLMLKQRFSNWFIFKYV